MLVGGQAAGFLIDIDPQETAEETAIDPLVRCIDLGHILVTVTDSEIEIVDRPEENHSAVVATGPGELGDQRYLGRRISMSGIGERNGKASEPVGALATHMRGLPHIEKPVLRKLRMKGEREQATVGSLGLSGEIKENLARRVSGVAYNRNAARALDNKGSLRLGRRKDHLDRLFEKNAAEGRRRLIR